MRTDLDATVRHFLRNLDNAPELRRNSLVSHLFGFTPDPKADCLAATGIRRNLERLLLHLNGRHRTMLEQCDLLGRPHKALAAELGLERRQFWRERLRTSTHYATRECMTGCYATEAVSSRQSRAPRGWRSAIC